MEARYIVRAFYQGLFYVKTYRSYNPTDIILELTEYKSSAQKLELDQASEVVKLLRQKGFIDLNIEEVK